MVEVLPLQTPMGNVIDAVDYADYAALKAENERLTKERDALIKSVADHVTVRGEYYERLQAAERALAERAGGLLDPDMPAQEMRLHMGEMTAQEMRTARAAIRWANTRLTTETAAPEGRQDDDRIRREMDEILRKQSERDIPFAPSTRPSEQAVTEAMVRAAAEILLGRVNAPEQEIYSAAAAALKAAMEAGRHG